jgi:hypothetical protein
MHTSTHSWWVCEDVFALSHLSVVMVQPGQDRNSNHLGSLVRRGSGGFRGVGKLLLNTLMWSSLIEVVHILLEHTLELLLLKDQQVV